jgi:dephospho-CoA kinase
MLNVAITGGIAEGKSTVLGYLKGMGCKTASADDVARTVFESDRVQDRLAELLGAPKPVTPPDLREHLWENSNLRRAVNSMMHPLILRKLEELKADVIEVPLLIETCLHGHFRHVWVVTCGLEEQRNRLQMRLGSGAEVGGVIDSQLPSEVKCAFADVIVRTNRPPEDVIRFITAVARRSFG